MSARDCQPVPDGEGDWTIWVHPLPGYRMQCCDCGLVHVAEFAIAEPAADVAQFNEGEDASGVVVFRMRREDP